MTPLAECRAMFLPSKDMEWAPVTHNNEATVHADGKFPLIAVGQRRMRAKIEWEVTRIERAADFSVAASDRGEGGARTGPWQVWMERVTTVESASGVVLGPTGTAHAFDPTEVQAKFKLPKPPAAPTVCAACGQRLPAE